MSIQKDAIGVTFELTVTEDDVAVDISSATTKRIDFEKATGVVVQQTASFVTDGTDGKLKYVSTDGDLDTVGAWRMQAYLVIGSFTGYTSAVSFTVLDNVT